MPADIEVSGNRGDAVAVTAYTPARLRPSAFSHSHATADGVGLLGPRLHVTSALGAAPPPLAPAQPRRLAERVDVADHHRRAVLADRPHAAAATPRTDGGRLHLQLDLTVDRARSHHAKVGKSQHDNIGCTTSDTT